MAPAACGTLLRELPAELEDVPWQGAPGDDQVLAARHLLDEGEERPALDLLEDVLADRPRHVDAHRLRQDVLRRRGRTALLRAEAERRLDERPGDVVSWYLLGRLVPGDAARRRVFERCVELAPRSFWSWLGYAYSLRQSDPEHALQLYGELYEASDGHPLAAVALAATLRDNGRLQAARAVYHGLRGRPEMPGVGDLGLAECWALEEDLDRAWAPLLTALKKRPADPGVQRLIARMVVGGLGDERLSQLLDVLRQDTARLEAFARENGEALLAGMLRRRGRTHAALALLSDADGEGPEKPASRRAWRRLLLATGDVKGFLAALDADYPQAFLDDETNQVRGLWHRVLRGPWRGMADPVADLRTGIGLVEALRDAGLLHEAERIADMLVVRHGGRGTGQPAGPGEDPLGKLAGIRAEIRRELAFEGAVRRVLYHGYLDGGEAGTIEAARAALRSLSEEILGRDVVGDPRLFSVPFVGELLDPFDPGIGRHFARYNRHLVLGRRSGGPVEGLLLTRLSVRDVPAVPELPLPTRCQEVVGENREIRSLSGVYGGDLAGVALLNHYVIDMDAVRDWSNDVLRKRRVAREDGEAVLDDPLPARHEAMEPLDVEWRLGLLSPEEDGDLELAVLDMIRRHEQAHLVDFFHFLPMEENLARGLGLIVGNGFSALAVEAEMEMRAEAVSLALSPHTRLVLAHVADFLGGDPARSAHAQGFRRLAEELIGRLREAGVPEEDLQPCRWHRLDPALVRRIGRALVGEFWD